MDRRNNIEMKDDTPGLVVPQKNLDDPFDIKVEAPSLDAGEADPLAAHNAPAPQINLY